jgi:hypothetical protein
MAKSSKRRLAWLILAERIAQTEAIEALKANGK